MLRFFFKRNISLPILGRWSITNCEIKVGRKVDLSNEDHCGCCYENLKGINNNEDGKNKYVNTNEDIVSKEESKKNDKYLIYFF